MKLYLTLIVAVLLLSVPRAWAIAADADDMSATEWKGHSAASPRPAIAARSERHGVESAVNTVVGELPPGSTQSVKEEKPPSKESQPADSTEKRNGGIPTSTEADGASPSDVASGSDSHAEPSASNADESQRSPTVSPDSTAIQSSMQTPPFPEGLELGDLVMRLALATGGVLVFGILAIVALKKWIPKAGVQSAPAKRMKLIETLNLPGRCSVQLVELDGNQVLVGMDAGGIRTIVPFSKPFAASLEELEAQAESAGNIEAVRTVVSEEDSSDEEANAVAGLEAISSQRMEIDELLQRTARLVSKPVTVADH